MLFLEEFQGVTSVRLCMTVSNRSRGQRKCPETKMQRRALGTLGETAHPADALFNVVIRD